MAHTMCRSGKSIYCECGVYIGAIPYAIDPVDLNNMWLSLRCDFLHHVLDSNGIPRTEKVGTPSQIASNIGDGFSL